MKIIKSLLLFILFLTIVYFSFYGFSLFLTWSLSALIDTNFLLILIIGIISIFLSVGIGRLIAVLITIALAYIDNNRLMRLGKWATMLSMFFFFDTLVDLYDQLKPIHFTGIVILLIALSIVGNIAAPTFKISVE